MRTLIISGLGLCLMCAGGMLNRHDEVKVKTLAIHSRGVVSSRDIQVCWRRPYRILHSKDSTIVLYHTLSIQRTDDCFGGIQDNRSERG
jgi:hypothetical protein